MKPRMKIILNADISAGPPNSILVKKKKPIYYDLKGKLRRSFEELGVEKPLIDKISSRYKITNILNKDAFSFVAKGICR